MLFLAIVCYLYFSSIQLSVESSPSFPPHVCSPTYLSQLYATSRTTTEQFHDQFLNVAQWHPPRCVALYTAQLVPRRLDLAVRERIGYISPDDSVS